MKRLWSLGVPMMLAAQLHAQSVVHGDGVANRASVVGIAFDSLRKAPLKGASITLNVERKRGEEGAATAGRRYVNDSRSTRSDSSGVFRFDSLAPGEYRLALTHDLLDSIGISGIGARANVWGGVDTIRLAVPSFETLWRAVCGTRPPSDSGFIYGSVQSVSGDAVEAAKVSASWIDVDTSLVTRGWRLEAETNASGDYALCGVAVGNGTRVRATIDSAFSGAIDILLPANIKIQRRDLIVGSPADSTEVGTIIGLVKANGRPIADAIATIEGMPEARSDRSGRFVVKGVPAGSRQIEVRSIGRVAGLIAVDLAPDDTAYVETNLREVVALDAVEIKASRVRAQFIRDIADRRKTGLGYFRDSTQIQNRGTLASVFREFLPLSVVETSGGLQLFFERIVNGQPTRCLAQLWIDKVKLNQDQLVFLRPPDVVAIEVFRHLVAPTEFPSGGCGSVVVWTKYIMP